MEDLRAGEGEGLGRLASDGGRPIDGMARCLDHDNWEPIVRKMFCTAPAL